MVSFSIYFLYIQIRNLFLADPMQPQPGDPVVIPLEFEHLRILLRNYIQNLLTRSGADDGESAFSDVADFFVSEFRDFIDRMVGSLIFIYEYHIKLD